MTEYWDLYDENRQPLHRKHIRGMRMPKGTYHVAVGIWTVSPDGRILLTLRSPEKRDWPLMWENTAGSLVSGEHSRQGAVRELSEETGIRASEEELYLIGTERSRNAFGDCYMIRRIPEETPITLQTGETCEYQWVTLPALDDMLEKGEIAPPVSRRLRMIRKKFEDYLYGRIGQGETT